MKHLKLLLTILFLSLYVNSYGQKSQKQIDLEKNKVQIFSDEERANLQLHFYDKTQEMNLSEAVEEEYYRLLLHYVYDIQRLNDKDKDFTNDEVKVELEKLVTKMNTKIQPVLSEAHYQTHLNNFNDILKSIYRRNGWEWNAN
jgi:predicted RNA-binding protein Jag